MVDRCLIERGVAILGHVWAVRRWAYVGKGMEGRSHDEKESKVRHLYSHSRPRLQVTQRLMLNGIWA